MGQAVSASSTRACTMRDITDPSKGSWGMLAPPTRPLPHPPRRRAHRHASRAFICALHRVHAAAPTAARAVSCRCPHDKRRWQTANGANAMVRQGRRVRLGDASKHTGASWESWCEPGCGSTLARCRPHSPSQYPLPHLGTETPFQ